MIPSFQPDKHTRFNYADASDLQRDLNAAEANLQISDDISPLLLPLQLMARGLKSRTINSRMCIQPMEGCDSEADGSPGELTFRRYRRFAAGGAGIIWVEACAVTPDCRANPRQLCLTLANKAAFATLVNTIRSEAAASRGSDHRPFLVLQITHSGRYTKPKPVIAFHDPILDPTVSIAPDYPVVTDSELESIEEAFAKSAELAFEVGFDAVDVKSCHRYLINELLAAHTRPGRYGGDYANRTRFLKNAVARIRESAGPDAVIACRLNVFDAHPYPYGWGVERSEKPDGSDRPAPDFSEPRRLVKELRELGVRLFNATAGNPYFTPHVNRPYDRHVEGNEPAPHHPISGVARLLECSREVQDAAPDAVVVGSGLSWLRDLWPQVAAAAMRAGWMTVAGLGREAFAYPDFARDLIQNGELSRKKTCVTCSRCTELMRAGKPVGCVPFDAEIYGKLYRETRGG